MTGSLGDQDWLQTLFDELSIALPQSTIVDWLGEGGMGIVAKAHQPLLDRHVAIKVLSGEPDGSDDSIAVQRFLAEARAMARLNHPNIVALYDFGRTESGRFFLVMEFVEGTGLEQLIHAQVLEPGHVLSIGPQICEALEYAHNKGVVHRDIKPANILVTPDGRAKILDFGLARAFADEDTSALAQKLTIDTQTIGTPDYMAPERIQGNEVDGRADIYSLGVMFYEMLVGRTPKGAFRPASELLENVDPRFDGVINAAMRHDPEERFATAAALKDALESLNHEAKDTPRRSLRLSTSSVGQDTEAVQLVSTETHLRQMRKGTHLRGNASSLLKWIAIGATGVVAVAGVALFFLGGQNEPADESSASSTSAAPDAEMTEAVPRLAADRGPDGTTAFDTLAWELRKKLNAPPSRTGTFTFFPKPGAPSALPPGLAPPADLPKDLVALAVSTKPDQPFIIALRSDGQPIAWGHNEFGQANPPSIAEGANHLVDVQAGDRWALGLREDGQLIPWGKMTAYPSEANDIVQIAASGQNAVALDADGYVFLWSIDGLIGPQPVPNAEGAERVDFDAEGHPIAYEKSGRKKRIGPEGNDFFAPVALAKEIKLPIDRGQYFALAQSKEFIFALVDPSRMPPATPSPAPAPAPTPVAPEEPTKPMKPAIPPVNDPRFTKLINAFETTVATNVIGATKSGRKNLTNRFIGLLKQEGNKVYAAGDQPAVETFKKEIIAFGETEKPSPDPTTNGTIRRLRLDWEIANANLEVTQANIVGPLMSKFGNDLAALEKKLTREAKIDDAILVREFRQNVSPWIKQLRTALGEGVTERAP